MNDPGFTADDYWTRVLDAERAYAKARALGAQRQSEARAISADDREIRDWTNWYQVVEAHASELDARVHSAAQSVGTRALPLPTIQVPPEIELADLEAITQDLTERAEIVELAAARILRDRRHQRQIFRFAGVAAVVVVILALIFRAFRANTFLGLILLGLIFFAIRAWTKFRRTEPHWSQNTNEGRNDG